MAIDFPNSPSVNDSFSAGGKTWVYNGTKWVLLSVSLNQAVADSAITAAKILNSNVTTAKIADDAVTAAKLADTAVTPGAYTTADITVDAQGRITTASSGVSAAAADDDQPILVSIIFT